MRESIVSRNTFAVLALAAVAACADPSGPGDEAPAVITALPRPLTTAEARATEGTTHFALQLFRRVAASRPEQNLLTSPFSVSMALGFLATAVDGPGHEALRDSLGFAGMSREQLGAAYRDLVPMLTSLDPKVRLAIVNGLFVTNGFPLEPAFVQGARDWFRAEAREVDLGSRAGADAINRWASDATSGRITNVFEPNPDLVTVLANAVHFDAEWRSRFDPARTSPGPFAAPGGSVPVPMMRSAEIPARYYADAEVEALDLPYGGDAWAMTIVLPRQGRTLASVVAALDTARWHRWTSRMSEAKALVTMPKYTTDWKDDLLPTLEAMGALPNRLAGAFRPMTPAYANLQVSFVKHATWMQVDERGTEAAAVTTVGIERTSAPAGPIPFVVDRPFLVAIRERLSGTVLFLGQVVRP